MSGPPGAVATAQEAWGHPTGDFVAENQALPPEQRAQMNTEFEALLTQMQERGELVSAEALGYPAALGALVRRAPLLDLPVMARHHRTHAVRAHLLEQAGRAEEALAAYREAARLTRSLPEQRYLNHRAQRLAESTP